MTLAMAPHWKSYFPDLEGAGVAFVAGLAVIVYLNGRWYPGWLNFFGEVPAMNPAYPGVVAIFQNAQFISAGAVTGAIAGIGRPAMARIMIRSIAILPCLIVATLWGLRLSMAVYLPVAVAVFALTSGLSCLHFGFGKKRRSDVAADQH